MWRIRIYQDCLEKKGIHMKFFIIEEKEKNDRK